MPFINIKVLKGTLSDDKKKEIISRVTETVAEIERGPYRKKTSFPTHGVSSRRLTSKDGG
jgi:hypothetical protein